MHLLLFVTYLVLLVVLSYASPLQKFLTGVEQNAKNDSADVADIWALLVAGSSTWMNYRHQVQLNMLYLSSFCFLLRATYL